MDSLLTSQQDAKPEDAVSLGFMLPVAEAEVPPPEGVPSMLADVSDPVLAGEARVDMYRDLVRQNAMVTVLEMQRDLAFRGLDPAATISQKRDIMDIQMRLADVDAKKHQSGPAGGGFSLNMYFSSAKPEHLGGVTIEHA